MKSIIEVFLEFGRDTRGMEVSEYAVVGVIIAFTSAAVFVALSNAIAQWVTAMGNILIGAGP